MVQRQRAYTHGRYIVVQAAVHVMTSRVCVCTNSKNTIMSIDDVSCNTRSDDDDGDVDHVVHHHQWRHYKHSIMTRLHWLSGGVYTWFPVQIIANVFALAGSVGQVFRAKPTERSPKIKWQKCKLKERNWPRQSPQHIRGFLTRCASKCDII